MKAGVSVYAYQIGVGLQKNWLVPLECCDNLTVQG